MKINPLSDYILIEPIEDKDEKTDSGIIVPETAKKERPEKGKVIAVGPGKRTDDGEVIPPKVEEGDKVLFTKHGPNEIKVGKKKYLVAKEDYIFATIED